MNALINTIAQFESNNNPYIKRGRQNKNNAQHESVHADWIAQYNIDALVSAWLTGEDIAWEEMYLPNEAYRISAPTYVFDKQRYWVDVAEQNAVDVASLHPLLDRNVSTLDEQLFEKRFNEQAFYLNDHRFSFFLLSLFLT